MSIEIDLGKIEENKLIHLVVGLLQTYSNVILSMFSQTHGQNFVKLLDEIMSTEELDTINRKLGACQALLERSDICGIRQITRDEFKLIHYFHALISQLFLIVDTKLEYPDTDLESYKKQITEIISEYDDPDSFPNTSSMIDVLDEI